MTAEAAQAQAHFVPDVSHARREQVYEVSEDTLLLADSIEKDAALLHQLRPALCLEIGAGSGYVSAVLAHTLQAPALCFATDINAAAASATALTMRKNPPPHGLLCSFCSLPLFFFVKSLLTVVMGATTARFGDVVLMDLASCFEGRMAGKVDVLVFNPPYVVTEPEELRRAVRERDLAAAWAGGTDGTEVLDRLIPRLPALLSPRGVFYLVAIAENKPTAISRRLLALGFVPKIVLTTVAAQEKLLVIRFTRVPARQPSSSRP